MLIDANKLCKSIDKNTEEGRILLDILIKAIEEQPKVDIESVRTHGKWDVEPYLLGKTHRCNLCGMNYGMPHEIYNYCPNCGARMDLEEKK